MGDHRQRQGGKTSRQSVRILKPIIWKRVSMKCVLHLICLSVLATVLLAVDTDSQQQDDQLARRFWPGKRNDENQAIARRWMFGKRNDENQAIARRWIFGKRNDENQAIARRWIFGKRNDENQAIARRWLFGKRNDENQAI